MGADVRFVDLKEVYEKSQSRSGGVAKQRVDDGLVHMEAQSPVGQILGIKVWVLREPQAAELHRDRNGPVELPVNHGEHDIEKVFYLIKFALSVQVLKGGKRLEHFVSF